MNCIDDVVCLGTCRHLYGLDNRSHLDGCDMSEEKLSHSMLDNTVELN